MAESKPPLPWLLPVVSIAVTLILAGASTAYTAGAIGPRLDAMAKAVERLEGATASKPELAALAARVERLERRDESTTASDQQVAARLGEMATSIKGLDAQVQLLSGVLMRPATVPARR